MSDDFPETQEDWIYTYADAITLLMAFFVMLYSMSSPDPEAFEAMRSSIITHISNPTTDLIDSPPPARESENRAIDQMKKTLREMTEAGKASITAIPEGAEIVLQGDALFAPGAVDLKPEAQTTIEALAADYMSESFGYQILVEGHTDSTPVKGKGVLRSNWDVAALRAARVVDIFYKAGTRRDRIEATAFADTKPVAPNTDRHGEGIQANQARNRRIIIRLLRP